MIRAVTFDVGGTLMAPYPSVGHVYARVAAAHIGFAADPERITRQFVNAWRARGEFDYSREGWFDLVRHSFHGVAEVSESLFTALYDSFSTHDAWRIYEDVIPCFESLQKQNIRLAVISNWDTRLKPTLKSVGLHDYFEVITVSGEHGHNKPAREIFEATAAALKLDPREILHIGDSHREDYLGARNAEFQALHLDRDAKNEMKVISIEEGPTVNSSPSSRTGSLSGVNISPSPQEGDGCDEGADIISSLENVIWRLSPFHNQTS